MQDTLTSSNTESGELVSRGDFVLLRTDGTLGTATGVSVKGFHPVSEAWITKGTSTSPASITNLEDEIRIWTVPGERLRVDIDGSPNGSTSIEVWLENINSIRS